MTDDERQTLLDEAWEKLDNECAKYFLELLNGPRLHNYEVTLSRTVEKHTQIRVIKVFEADEEAAKKKALERAVPSDHDSMGRSLWNGRGNTNTDSIKVDEVRQYD